MTLTRREFMTSTVGLTALALPGKGHCALPGPGATFAVSGHILTGIDSTTRTNHAVVVQHGRIMDIIPAGEVRDVPLLNFPYATIMPGIINCHVHRCHTPTDRRERFLMHGVTSVGDVGSPMSALPGLLESPAGATATATCSGPMLCPPGGYPLPVHSDEHALTVTSPFNGRERVRQLRDRGATMIKVAMEPGPFAAPWPMFDANTLHAICNESRRWDLTVRCHMEDFFGLETALDAGVHTIEHVPHRWLDGNGKRSILRGGELVPTYRSQLERMVRDGVILTPTLDVLSRTVWDGSELFEPVRAFTAMGGRIAVGNDYPYRRTDAGMPLREMDLLAKAGLKTGEILTAATRDSAMACGFADRGTLAPGMRADMIIVRGSPIDDLEALNQPIHVIKDSVFTNAPRFADGIAFP